MIIANIELSKTEDYSPFNCTRYGGGSIFCKYALTLLNNEKSSFTAYGQKENFENVKIAEGKNFCKELTENQIQLLKQGFPVIQVIPESVNWDILLHNQECFEFNISGLKCKQICWLAFVNQTVTRGNHGCFIYSMDQKPRFDPNYTKAYKVKIGNYVSDTFTDHPKGEYLFQITRMDSVMNPIKTVQLCNKFKIKGLFAGPILDNYPLLDYIDNENTFYLGVLCEEAKIEYLKGAKLFGGIQDWETIWNLSVHQALSYNTPVICYNKGFFKEVIQEGVNGFFYDDDEDNFLAIWRKAGILNRQQIWESSHNWSHREMVKSFYKGFEEILK